MLYLYLHVDFEFSLSWFYIAFLQSNFIRKCFIISFRNLSLLLFSWCEETPWPKQFIKQKAFNFRLHKVSEGWVHDHCEWQQPGRQAGMELEQSVCHTEQAERRDWGCWPGLWKPHSLPTVSHLQRPHLLILPKQCHQLETRHSIMWASGAHFHSNHQSTKTL